MIKVLFVCTGNICRSPIAEETFRLVVKKRNLQRQIQCDSAATHSYHIGELPDHRTRKNAQSHGINLTHKCRRLTGEDFSVFDYIVGMDYYNMDNIQGISYRATGIYQPDEVCFLYRRFDPAVEIPNRYFPINHQDVAIPEVPDPYYGDSKDFEEVYQIVTRCAEAFLDFLVETHGLA